MEEIISKPSEWEKIIANETTDKQLITKIYKQLLQLNTRKINDPSKMGQRTIQIFLLASRVLNDYIYSFKR